MLDLLRGDRQLATCFPHRREGADDLRIDERFDPYHFCSALCMMQLEISLILRASQ
jgi:hypothetical protein